MSVESLTPRVREALGVSSSYDNETIPAAIRRAMKRLLRDYNFPKTLRTKIWTYDAVAPEDAIAIGQTYFPFPAGLKKDLMLIYTSPGTNPPKTTSYSDALKKNPGFRLPHHGDLAMAKYYWLEGKGFSIDKPLYDPPTEALSLLLYWQSWDVTDNEEWLCEDYEDILYILTCYRTAAEMRKAEVMQAYKPLWDEEAASLAIYVNELEFDNMVIMQREAVGGLAERYPV